MGEEYRFSHRLKVRYSEIDGQKIVFNAHYLTYIDVAVSEYFEEGLKLRLSQLEGKEHFDFVLAKTTLEFKSSAKLGDWLKIWCRVKSIGRTSFTLQFKITREGDDNIPLLMAETIYVGYDGKAQKTIPVPNYIRERMEEFEGRKLS